MQYRFYGAGAATCAPLDPACPIRDPRHLYDILTTLWCRRSCAPRLQAEWTPDNPTLGQCSITAFLAQDIFGGEVYGIPRPGGNYHCYNVVNGITFDLTSEQFLGEPLSYQDNPLQERAVHFAKEEKHQRYLWLKDALSTKLAAMADGITVRPFHGEDLPEMADIWNTVVQDGIAFPQEETLTVEAADAFFSAQSLSAVATDADGAILGLYILHPNNVGRCGHIANASYAVRKDLRGRHIGEKLVADCLVEGARHGFSVLQFNAVVATNVHARHLYERLGFRQLGTIPGGFRMKDGHYEDICPYYHTL